MKLIKHPNVVHLKEVFYHTCTTIVFLSMNLLITRLLTFTQVLASKKKIYIVLEYANGGELFQRIVGFFSHQILVRLHYKQLPTFSPTLM